MKDKERTSEINNEAGKNKVPGRKGKIALIIISSVLCLSVIITALGITDIVPAFSIIPDMVNVGTDYISLSINKNAPTISDINVELNKTQNLHPFIFATGEDFDRIKEDSEKGFSDEYEKAHYDYIIKNADALLNKDAFPVSEYVLDEEDSILPVSRECINRIVILSFSYNVTGEEKYALRALEELEAVCSFPDWCNSHFLATAEMALAVSIGYDWLYDYLTDEQKITLREKTWEYAINPALSKNYLKNWFTWSKNNWNSICYSGVGIAAMAFYEKDSYKAAEFLNMCYKNMPIAFDSFTPDGVYAEGPGYCQSGMNAIVYFLSSSFNLFGTDFGLTEIDGVKQLGFFPLYITGSAGVFNFGDNKNRKCYSPALLWYADKYISPELAEYQKNDVPGVFSPDLSENTERNGTGKDSVLSLLWLGENNNTDAKAQSIALSRLLRSDSGQDIAVLTSGFNDKNAVYAAIKGGYNYINHGDLDIGTFVFDSQGVRWAEELGPGSYDAPGYFMGLPFGGRWNNYCKRAEGQNTLVINPDSTKEDQYALGKAEVISFEETADGGTVIINMTDAYKMNGVKSAVREFSLCDNKTALEITDTVECRRESEIYWFMHTKADISISEDKKSAVLTKDGKTMNVTLQEDGTFSVTEAVKLQGKYEYDEDYSDIKKLTIHIEGVKSAKIKVKLSPG